MRSTLTILSLLIAGPLSAQSPPEVLTVAPRLAAPAIEVTPTKFGYTLRLDRPTAEAMRDALMDVKDPKGVAESLKEAVDAERRPEVAAAVRSFALVFASQAGPMREALQKKTGEQGILFNVYGVPKAARKDRPLVRAIIRAAAPDEFTKAMRDAKLVLDTEAVYWIAEPVK